MLGTDPVTTDTGQQQSVQRPHLIVGLGNPGPDYACTRHNVGFDILDRLRAEATGVRQMHRSPRGLAWSGQLADDAVHLLKPMTFMNRSGVAVRETLEKAGLDSADVLVVYDCMDLPLGRLRLRRKGGSGGHLGMESIIMELGTERFPRLRVGIGRPSGEVIDHVLSRWTVREQPLRCDVIEVATEAVCFAVRRGMDAAMNAYNPWVSAHHSHTAELEGE